MDGAQNLLARVHACVRTSVRACVHTRVQTCVRKCVRAYMGAHACVRAHTLMLARTHVRTYVLVRTVVRGQRPHVLYTMDGSQILLARVHACVHTSVRACVHTRVQTCVRKCVRAYMGAHACVRTHQCPIVWGKCIEKRPGCFPMHFPHETKLKQQSHSESVRRNVCPNLVCEPCVNQ